MGKKHKKHTGEQNSVDASAENSMNADDTSSQGDAVQGEKTLKLVFKFGHQEASDSAGASQGEERLKHKHKKKKKRKEEKDKEEFCVQESFGVKRTAADDIAEEPPEKKYYFETENNGDDGETIEDRVRHSPRSCAIRSDDGAILRQCLEFLQRVLQNKDVNGFFAYPVTDSIAPGYSSIIHSPMDFSTMETKIERNEYRSVMEYKKDFMLMCNNAMTYNRPETVYYKEAKRLLLLGAKQLSKEKLLHMRKTQSWMANLTLAEIGIDVHGNILEELPPIIEELKLKEKPKSKSTKVVSGPFEPFPDQLSPEEILVQVQGAAKKAQQELTMRKPKTDLVFFRRNKKGVTSLNILNPENDGIVSDSERVVNLAEMCGRLKEGTGYLSTFREDKRNKVIPVHYLSYGPFSSFAPQYDSSFANVSKEESDLLLSTYGDETGVQYAKSVLSFVDTAGDYAVKMVNNLLDMLTKGQHTRTNHALEQQRKLEREKAAAEAAELEAQASVNCEPSALPEGSQVTDTSFEGPHVEEDPIQKRLNSTAEMIGDLQKVQNVRLGQTPPTYVGAFTGPSEKEIELASKVTEGLVDLTREATPAGVVTVESVRKAMGIAHPSSAAGLGYMQDAGGSEPEDGQPEGGIEMASPVKRAGTASASTCGAEEEEDDDEDDDEEDDDDEDESESDEEEDDDEEDEEEGQEREAEIGTGSLMVEGISEDLGEFFTNPPQGAEETSLDEASMDG